MRKCYSDLETFSPVPIKHGTFAYAEKVEVLLWLYAIDDGPAKCWDLTTGTPMPDDLRECYDDPETWFLFHNASFDRRMLERTPYPIPISRIYDTLTQAYCCGMPGALGKLSEILRMDQDTAKDKDGKRLIRLFCMPQKTSKSQPLARRTRETDPEDWAKFIEYGLHDITAMREVHRRLPKWNYGFDRTDWQRRLYEADARINDRGFRVDIDLMHAALSTTEETRSDLRDQISDETFGAVTSATKRTDFIDYVLEAYGISLTKLTKDTLGRLLDDDSISEGLKILLRIRLQAASAAPAKYKALANAVSSDGRMRGTLVYRGASRTGRWSGKIFQPQNLPRPGFEPEEIEEGISLIKAGLASEYCDDVMSLLASCLRGLIVPTQGNVLSVYDWSSIEGRVNAMLCGEMDEVEAFRAYDNGKGPDLYCVTAAAMFGLTPEDVIKDKKAGGNLRQIGKAAFLGLGFLGGAGAFAQFAVVYGIDLEKVADTASDNIPKQYLLQAGKNYEWAKKQKRNMKGMTQRTWTVAEAFKLAWREAHPNIVRTGAELQEAAMLAIANPGETHKVGQFLRVRVGGNYLRIRLPSGRYLCYPAPRLVDGRITYMGTNQFTRQFERLDTYGGKLLENCTQATAADLMGFALIQCDEEGLPVVMDIHDEIIADCAPEQAPRLQQIMEQEREWFPGCPLAAAGYVTDTRYRKD